MGFLFLGELCELGFNLCPNGFNFGKLPKERQFQNNFCCSFKHTQLKAYSLPCALSTNTTLESCWKLCPLRSICSPPEAQQLSMLCLSTRGSSWAERWAAGEERERERVSKICKTCQISLYMFVSFNVNTVFNKV